MAQFPWSQRTQVEPQREYAVMASKLPLERSGSMPGFLRDTLAIRRQLRSASGLVGDALLAELSRKTFWTFSVRESRDSLDAFARSEPHNEIIRRLRPKMATTTFTFDAAAGAQLPWAWDEVRRRLQMASS
ncbi:MAG TPA: hypothetical protein VMD59_19720 [Acidimicrobiales bacterium]|nr:hypothetical protein [Acidimicrobiales bacterium]